MKYIAVVIPTYKPGSYIYRCLQSLNSQTLNKEKFKVYIALNGPKDKFYELIETVLKSMDFEYEFFYLDQIGVSNARNFLIDISVEPYITFIDDDDCVSSIYLESLLAVSNDNVIGISNVYNFEHDVHEKKSSYIGRSFLNLNDIETSKFKSRKYYSSPCAKLIHRNIIGTTRFNTKLAIGEDALFMAELSYKVKAVKKSSLEAIYYVFERPNSASRKKVKNIEEFQRVLYLTLQYIKLFFDYRYSRLFIATRIVATLRFLKRVF